MTVDLFHYWLNSELLPNNFDVQPLTQFGPKVIIGLDLFFKRNNGSYYVGDDWRGLVLEEHDTYSLKMEFYSTEIAPDSFTMGGSRFAFYATQWRTDRVDIAAVYVTDPPLQFGAMLRNWLKEIYGCELTHLQLTTDQQEKWNELQEFTSIVEQSGRELQDVEQAEFKVEPGTMRKRWNRLRAKLGADPPWPQTR